MGMKEVITYSDKPLSELLQKKYSDKISVLEDGGIKLKLDKIRTERNGEHSVSLIRCKDSDLWDYDEEGNQVAGWLQDVFTLCSDIADVYKGESAWDMVTPEGETLINLAYNRVYINDSGEKCLKPKCSGRFM